MYLIHAPDNQGQTPEEIRRLRQESWLVMEEAYRSGRCRAIGVSNFEPRHIEALLVQEDGSMREGAIVPAVNQIELHPRFDARATREYCAAKGIAVVAYGIVDDAEDPTVQRVATTNAKTPAQISLRHTYQARGAVVLAKSLSPRHIAENARIFDWELSAADLAALNALGSQAERSYWDNSDVP